MPRYLHVLVLVCVALLYSVMVVFLNIICLGSLLSGLICGQNRVASEIHNNLYYVFLVAYIINVYIY